MLECRSDRNRRSAERNIQKTTEKQTDAEKQRQKNRYFIDGRKNIRRCRLYAGKNNREYAKNLFHALREFVRLGAEIVFAEFMNDDEYRALP